MELHKTSVYTGFDVVVSGPFACFSPPYAKVERYSYPVITPSAAVGVLDSIYWHPGFSWFIKEIGILKPIQRLTLTRTELKKSPVGSTPVNADATTTLRRSVMLYDVAYRIKAGIRLWPNVSKYLTEENNRDPLSKFVGVAKRRIERGQYYSSPCLGIRECIADVRNASNDDLPLPTINECVGGLLLGFDYRRDKTPVFWDAQINGGVIQVPDIRVLRP